MLGKEVSNTIFKVFGITQPGIEPQSPRPLANTLSTWPISQLHTHAYIQIEPNFTCMHTHTHKHTHVQTYTHINYLKIYLCNYMHSHTC